MSILSVHQPHFFPWPSYFLKIKRSDCFVILDDVQFRKNYFQNRCEIINSEGTQKRWLTIPVKKKISSKSKINEVVLSENFTSAEVLALIASSYRQTPFYDEVYSDLEAIFSTDNNYLSDLNVRGIRWCLEVLDIQTTTVLSSKLEVPFCKDPTMRLINLCLHAGMKSYISGPGGKNYMDLPLFHENGIELLWHESESVSFQYPQMCEKFFPNLSILDMFFNIGYKESAGLFKRKFD